MINVIIVDDEPPAREVIKHYLTSYPEIKVLAEADNGFDAVKLVRELRPQLVFMDVQMPKLTGFETLDLMDEAPEVIFSTAFDHFAVHAFEMNAVDYLLKPYSRNRFDAALQKAVSRIEAAGAAPPAQALKTIDEAAPELLSRIAVKQRHQIHVIPISDIDYIEADGDYVHLHTPHGTFLKERTMKFFENNLPKPQFIRVHRSYIVNVDKVCKIEIYEKEAYHLHLRGSKDIVKASYAGYKLLREHIKL
jgi:two-component system LytT family response regulator